MGVVPGWRLLQVADSAFPVGGFGHSGGLEAAVQLGEVVDPDGVERFATAAVWQAATFALPFVREAWRAPERAAELELLCDTAQSSHVARRASRAQGRAWVRACVEIFGLAAIPAAHLPVVFGATAHLLDVDEPDAAGLYLYSTARGVVSAAVRLGCLGPHAGQRVQDRLAAVAEAAVCDERPVAAAAHSAPVWELYGTLHDALPSRLFQS